MNQNYAYKVGGSLAFNHPTYAERKADKDLLSALKKGNFCYVFNSRQMGKSSLRVRAMHQLQAEGMSCASIDITSLGSDLTQQQWYSGIITQLFLSFNLVSKVNLKVWLRERGELSSVQKLSQFLEEIILVYCPGEKVFIFIDEIDKVLSLNFSLDDFFTLIRFCYNQRAENVNYERLTFALFGVATPSDLIRDKTQTPFNIGQPIELMGFTEAEIQPLALGLKPITDNPQAVIKEILFWTGGQPFLTQKICQILLNNNTYIYAKDIEKVVNNQVIEHWESQDEPVHLKTIRDRLLRNDQRSGRLLGIYQQILQQGEIKFDDSYDQTELRLSGLVVKKNSSLSIYNPIYKKVFDQQWVNKNLDSFRPYSEAITAWIVSEYEDKSRLLRGQALKDALIWSADKSLGSIDYKFLSASQKLDQREAELNLETQRRANAILHQANHKAQQMIRLGIAILIASLLGSGIAFRQAYYASQKQREAQIGTQLQRTGDSAWRQFEFEQIESLISAMQAGQSLQLLVKDRRFLQNYPATSPLLNLQQILDIIQEKNVLEGHTDAVMSVSFSPDGNWIATASRDKTVRLWNRQGRKKIILKGHQGDVYSVSFSPNSKQIATASQDKTVKIWNLKGQELKTLRGHQESVYSVTFSPDGKLLATTSRDNTARLWNLEGKQLTIFKGHQKSVDEASFSPDGKLLATASRDGTVRLWNLQGKQIAIFQDNGVSFYSVSFSRDGKMIAAATKDGTSKIWNLQGDLLTTLKGHQELVNSIRFSPNNQQISTASSDGTAKIWNLKGQELATLKGHQEPVYSVAWSPNGEEIATASNDGTIKLWDLQKKPAIGFNSLENRLTSASIASNGQLLAVASEDGMVYIYDLQGNLKHQFQAYRNSIYSINFSPNNQKIVTVSNSGITKVWDLQGKELAIISEISQKEIRVYNAIFSPDGNQLAIATKEGQVFLWNIKGKPEKILSFQAHKEAIYNLSFSPDGKYLATASRDKTTKLWDLMGHLKITFQGHQDLVSGVSFNPINDSISEKIGQYIVTSSRDGTTKIWELTGKLLKTLQGDPFSVDNVSLSPNGQRIATASSDGTVRLWDIQGNLRAEFKGHQGAIYAIQFTPNSQQVITISRDGSVRIWQVEEELTRLERLLKQGCQWLEDYLATHPDEQEKLTVCLKH